MRGIVLVSLILAATAVPAASQMAIGVRAGVGSAWMASPRGVHFEPCPPDMECPYPADDAVRGFTFGAEFDIPVSNSSEVLGLRIGAAYARKGGATSRDDADGKASVGLEGIYYRGLREYSGGYSEMTRLAAVQVGFAYRIG